MLACVWLESVDDALLRQLFAVTPVLSARGEVVFLDLRGTERLHRGTAGAIAAIRAALAPGVPRGIGLAGNRFTAEIAARTGRAVAVPPGDEALFLAHLPLAVLPLSAGLARRLEPLGLRTLGDFASLPLGSVERRYGPEGVAMHRLARGDDEAALVPLRPDEDLRVLARVEPPAVAFDALAGQLGEALGQLATALDERDRGVSRLVLRCELDPARDVEADEVFGPPSAHAPEVWEVLPASPEARAPLLLDLLALQLERRPPRGAVTGLLLHAAEVAPLAVHQNGLFGEVARDASRRAEALSRLVATLGPEVARRPRVRREHLLEQRWTDEVASEGDGVRDAGARASKTSRAGSATGATGRAAKAARGASRVAERGVDETSRAASGVPLVGSVADPGDVGGARRRPGDEPACGPTLRLLRRPEVLVPLLAGGELVGFRRGRIELRVARLSAPRRLEGGWWRDAWARDEHDLVTDDGAIWRICRDMPTRRWLLLGEFD
ncbi:MAG: hypothetical protein H6825_10685 [Planctomycetes bacterium]|nr:hypothetical protein [Planctomycetota bacterium]